MRTLRTSEAAAYLNVSPNTLRGWEQRYGYPRPERSPGRHRIYHFAELVALREALSDGHGLSSAITAAREAVSADEQTLTAALLSFDYVRADRAMERGLSLLTFEGAVNELLLPALAQIEARQTCTSAACAFAVRWAEEWLGRAQRIAAGADTRRGVLFADCFAGRLGVDVIQARVLEVFCVRSGVNVLRLPVNHNRHLERLTVAFEPVMLVLVGSGASAEEVTAFSHVVCTHAGPIPRLRYRRPHGPGDRLPALPTLPTEARDGIFQQLTRRTRRGLNAAPPGILRRTRASNGGP